jgi:O-antigen/teichoic acid export membrane protein
MNRLSIDSLLSICVRVLGGVSTYLLTIVVARVLGVEDAGAFFLGLSTILFLATFSQLGLDVVTLKYTGIFYANDDHSRRFTLARNNLFIVMAFSSLVAASVFIFNRPLASLFDDTIRLSNVFRYLSPVIATTASLMIIGMFLQGSHRPLTSILLTKIFFPTVLIICLLLFSHPSLSSVSKTATISSLIVLLVTLAWWFIANRTQAIKLSDEKLSVGNLLRSASVLWIITMLSQALLWLPQLFAGISLGFTEVAQLSIAIKTAMLVGIVLVSINMIVAPRFAAHYDQGNILEFRQLFKSTLRLSLCITLPVIAGLFLLSPNLVLVFGDDYIGASLLLKVILFGELVNVICGSVGYALIMTGNEKELRNSALIALIAAVLLNYFLIQQYGMLGCAIAYSLSIALYNLCSAYWVNKRLGFNPLVFW